MSNVGATTSIFVEPAGQPGPEFPPPLPPLPPPPPAPPPAPHDPDRAGAPAEDHAVIVEICAVLSVRGACGIGLIIALTRAAIRWWIFCPGNSALSACVSAYVKSGMGAPYNGG